MSTVVVSLRGFGIVPDGATDSAPAFQEAADVLRRLAEAFPLATIVAPIDTGQAVTIPAPTTDAPRK